MFNNFANWPFAEGTYRSQITQKQTFLKKLKIFFKVIEDLILWFVYYYIGGVYTS